MDTFTISNFDRKIMSSTPQDAAGPTAPPPPPPPAAPAKEQAISKMQKGTLYVLITIPLLGTAILTSRSEKFTANGFAHVFGSLFLHLPTATEF
jgi:cytochrome b561